MARNVLVETGGEGAYSLGRGNLKAVKTGERDKSSARSESNKSAREREVAVNCSNGSKRQLRIRDGKQSGLRPTAFFQKLFKLRRKLRPSRKLFHNIAALF